MFDFLSVKKSIGSLQQRYVDLQGEIQATERQLSQMRNAHINKSDLPEIIDRWLERSAAGFTSAVAAHLTKNYITGTNQRGDVGFFSLMKNGADELSASAMDGAMCAAFGGQIKTALVTAIDAMAWPSEGLPKAKRAIEVERLEKLSQSLRIELEKIKKGASDAGIILDTSGGWRD